MRWPWRGRRRRIAALDARLADAASAAASANGEVRESEERYETVRKHVVQPLQEAARNNRFADMIRATLISRKDYS